MKYFIPLFNDIMTNTSAFVKSAAGVNSVELFKAKKKNNGILIST